jgi:hypothetical protein
VNNVSKVAKKKKKKNLQPPPQASSEGDREPSHHLKTQKHLGLCKPDCSTLAASSWNTISAGILKERGTSVPSYML